MKVASIPKQKAVKALNSEVLKRLKSGRGQQARDLLKSTQAINRADGDTVWDIYSKANDQRKPWEKVGELIIPKPETEADRTTGYKRTALFLGAVAVGTAVGGYLTGASIGASLGYGAIPVGASAVATFFTSDSYGDDSTRAGVITASGIGAGVAAGVMTNNPWIGVGLAAGVILGEVGVYQASRAFESRSREAMEAIEAQSSLLKDPAILAGTNAPEDIAREDLFETLRGLSEESLDDGNFPQALRYGELSKSLNKLSGDSFAAIYASALDEPSVAEILEQEAPKIFGAAEELQEVRRLSKGASSDVEIKVGEDYVEVGDVLIQKDQ